MLPESFAGSFYPQRPHRVLGRTLRPFGLWHQFLLEAIESPLIGRSDHPATVIDLELAVRVCTASWPQSACEVTGAVPRPSLRQKLRLVFLVRQFDIEVEAQRFSAYVRDHCQYPEFWSSSGGGDELSAPPVVGSILTQLLILGYPEKEAWGLAPGKAHWLTAMAARAGGADMRFFALSPKQVELAEKFKADYAAKKAAAAAEATGTATLTPDAPSNG